MGVNENWKENLDARDEVNWRNPKLTITPASLHWEVIWGISDYDLKYITALSVSRERSVQL